MTPLRLKGKWITSSNSKPNPGAFGTSTWEKNWILVHIYLLYFYKKYILYDVQEIKKLFSQFPNKQSISQRIVLTIPHLNYFTYSLGPFLFSFNLIGWRYIQRYDVSVEEAEEFHIFHNVIKNQFDYDKLLIQSNLWTSWNIYIHI